jgi:hypothetical protein
VITVQAHAAQLDAHCHVPLDQLKTDREAHKAPDQLQQLVRSRRRRRLPVHHFLDVRPTHFSDKPVAVIDTEPFKLQCQIAARDRRPSLHYAAGLVPLDHPAEHPMWIAAVGRFAIGPLALARSFIGRSESRRAIVARQVAIDHPRPKTPAHPPATVE